MSHPYEFLYVIFFVFFCYFVEIDLVQTFWVADQVSEVKNKVMTAVASCEKLKYEMLVDIKFL